MRPTLTLLLALVTSGLAFTTPVARTNDTSSLHPPIRALQFWKEANYTDLFTIFDFERLGVCRNVGRGNDHCTSAKILAPNVLCIAYIDLDCSGDRLLIDRDIPDMAAYPGWDNAISSVRCFHEKTRKELEGGPVE